MTPEDHKRLRTHLRVWCRFDRVLRHWRSKTPASRSDRNGEGHPLDPALKSIRNTIRVLRAALGDDVLLAISAPVNDDCVKHSGKASG